MPTRMVTERDEIDLGDRVITFQAHRPAHTVTDLSLFDKTSGLFLPADLLFVGRVPALAGSLTGWIGELEAALVFPRDFGTRLTAVRRAVQRGEKPADLPNPEIICSSAKEKSELT